jgi:hypothetical protein
MMSPDGVPDLSADFAQRVLRKVDRVRRRRVIAGVVGIVALAVIIALRMGSPFPSMSPAAAPTLVASDFSWLEEVGTSTSTPSAIVFPDESQIDENVLVAVAEGL